MDKSPAETSAPDSVPNAWGWTRTHRIGIAAISAITLVFLSIGYFRSPYRLDDPIILVNGTQPVLQQQIDPNTADWPALARLPHIGETLAKRLVAFRQENAANTTDGIVFHQLDDLAKIPGFGPKTREALGPYLIFPDGPGPATSPARGEMK